MRTNTDRTVNNSGLDGPYTSNLHESSLGRLFDSAIAAFPYTTMRQYATGPIQIDQVNSVPFVGMSTLLFRYHATNEERVYQPSVLFLNVDYKGTGASIIASDNKKAYNFTPISEERTNAKVRCSCLDYNYRFHHYNFLDSSLYGPNRKPYIGKGGMPANPTESAGICKHLMAFMEHLRKIKILV